MKTGLNGLMEAVAGRETGIIPSRMICSEKTVLLCGRIKSGTIKPVESDITVIL